MHDKPECFGGLFNRCFPINARVGCQPPEKKYSQFLAKQKSVFYAFICCLHKTQFFQFPLVILSCVICLFTFSSLSLDRVHFIFFVGRLFFDFSIFGFELIFSLINPHLSKLLGACVCIVLCYRELICFFPFQLFQLI